MGSFCTVVKVQNISFFCQHCKRIWSPCRLSDFFCTVLSKSGFSLQILIKVSNTKFHANPSIGSPGDTCGQTWQISARLTAEETKNCVRDMSLYHAGITQLFSHGNAKWCPRCARKRIPNKCKICSADAFVHCVSKYNIQPILFANELWWYGACISECVTGVTVSDALTVNCVIFGFSLMLLTRMNGTHC